MILNLAKEMTSSSNEAKILLMNLGQLMVRENLSCMMYIPLTDDELLKMSITAPIKSGVGFGKLDEESIIFINDKWSKRKLDYEKFGKKIETFLSKLLLV